MYDYVTIAPQDDLGNILTKTKYKFNIMKEKTPYQIKYGDFYELIKSENNHDNLTSNKKVNLVNYVIKDNLASIGQLLEIENYNSKGQLLNKLKNNYFLLNNIPNQIGVKKESYQSYKTIDYITNSSTVLDKWLVNSTTRITYPSILKSSSEQSNGYTYTTEFQDYDLVSGISKEQIHTSSDGKIFKTKLIPAYTKYPQMGSKVDDIRNRNMLSQTAASYSYIQDAGDWKVTGVGITTWNNIWSYQDIVGDVSSPVSDKEKIWRKHKSYTWNGVKDNNGIFLNYNDTNDDGFNWNVGVGSQPSQWKKLSEITLYDHFSTPLEVKDINGNKASTKMDALSQRIESTGNASYNELYYSGAEVSSGGGYWLGQEVRNDGGIITNDRAHTGKSSIATTSNSQFGVVMRNGHRPGKYRISVWVHKDNYVKARLRWFNNDVVNTFTFNGEKVFAGDWVLLNHYTDVHYMSNSNAYWYVNSIDNSTVYYDDLMIRPIASSITGYVYNEYDELTHIIGNNGLATRFEYDAAGRLIKTYVEIVDDPTNNTVGGFKLISENKYHYKNL
jgi:YD repeat-containing protein